MRVQRDQRFEPHEALTPRGSRGRRARGARQTHEAFDLLRQTHQRLQNLAVAWVDQLKRQRDAEIGNEGKGMRRIDGQRSQHGENAREKMILQPLAIRLGEIAGLDDDDADFLDVPPQLAPSAHLLIGQLDDALLDADELLPRAEPVLRKGVELRARLPAQTGDAHHEEFVEIIRRDRQKAQLLQQRMIAVRGLLEHAPIELEPGQFAVHEALGRGHQLFGTQQDIAGRFDHDGRFVWIVFFPRHANSPSNFTHSATGAPPGQRIFHSCRDRSNNSAASPRVTRRPRASASRSRSRTKARAASSERSSRRAI